MKIPGFEQIPYCSPQDKKHSFENQIVDNMPFVTSMIILPFVIIRFVVVLDKRK